MRLSTVFELLLIFLLIAFAAYGRVIDPDEATLRRVARAANESRQMNMGVEVMSLKQATENVNKYCICNENICNCCRNFNIPIVQLKGPGCASLQYLENDKLAVQLSMGQNILTSTVVNGQKPKAVCFPMPGGLTKFCGRIYSIKREADNHFKACLGLELQSATELEAALRVSCFRFGPDGVKLRPAEELPIVEADAPAEDDDDDDLFGLDDDDEEDEDEDEEDTPEGNAVPGSSTTNDESEDDEDDDDDILGFGALLDILTGDDDSDKKKKPQATTSVPILPFTIPMLTKPTEATPIVESIADTGFVSNVKPVTARPTIPTIVSQSPTLDNNVPSEISSIDTDKLEDPATESAEIVTSDEEPTEPTGEAVAEESSTELATGDGEIGNESAASDVVETIVSPVQSTGLKKVSVVSKKKPTLTSGSPNAIKNDKKKKPSSVIVPRPPKPDPVQLQAAVQQHETDEDDDEDDDEDILGASELDDDDDDEEDEKLELEEESEDEKDEDEDDSVDEEKPESEEENEQVDEQHEDEDVEDLIDDEDDDEDEEEEDAVLTALIDDDKEDIKGSDKVADNEAANPEEDDNDYGLGLAELLSRKRHMRSGRQSKVMRL